MMDFSFYLAHICALISQYQINTNEGTCILLNHQFINAILDSKMFQPLKGHFQGV